MLSYQNNLVSLKNKLQNRRKQQELQKAEEANAEKLMDVAKALGFAAEQLQVDGGNVSVKPSAADTEARRERVLLRMHEMKV